MLSVLLALLFVPGPIEAKVVRVLDGDTVEVKARPWVDLEVTTFVRVAGIDTPEKGWRAKCPAERELGERASLLAQKLMPLGATLRLLEVQKGKYAGRVVASVILPDGRDYASILIDEGLAYPYEGKTKRSFCEERP